MLSSWPWDRLAAAQGLQSDNVDIPFFEFFPVGVVLDTADHEVGQMAVLMGENVEKSVCMRIRSDLLSINGKMEPTFVVNNLLGKLDGRKMPMLRRH